MCWPGLPARRLQSEESALKYFLLGAFASAFFLYGAALIYGATGPHRPGGHCGGRADGGQLRTSALLLVGAALLLVGLGFKVSAVPFHMWTPDVYQGAPTPVTAWMSVSVKVAGFGGAAARVHRRLSRPGGWHLRPVLWGMAALTMIVGNLLAIVQTNIKRLLAYSSIAHVGYLLMAFVPYGNGEVVWRMPWRPPSSTWSAMG